MSQACCKTPWKVGHAQSHTQRHSRFHMWPRTDSLRRNKYVQNLSICHPFCPYIRTWTYQLTIQVCRAGTPAAANRSYHHTHNNIPCLTSLFRAKWPSSYCSLLFSSTLAAAASSAIPTPVPSPTRRGMRSCTNTWTKTALCATKTS